MVMASIHGVPRSVPASSACPMDSSQPAEAAMWIVRQCLVKASDVASRPRAAPTTAARTSPYRASVPTAMAKGR